MGNEGAELLAVTVGFPASLNEDPVIERFADRRMIQQMEQVFFSTAPNPLQHSYAGLMHGPNGRAELQDVIDLLREQPLTKRAVVTLAAEPNGKTPCINVVQFLVRENALQTMYFARGQDAFRKFYADGFCLKKMAQKVAAGLDLPVGWVTGFIGSSHVYEADMPAIDEMLATGQEYISAGEVEGVV